MFILATDYSTEVGQSWTKQDLITAQVMVAYTCSTLSKSNHVGPQNVSVHVHIHVIIATIIKFIYNDGAISLVIDLCLLLLLLGCQPRNAHHMTIT